MTEPQQPQSVEALPSLGEELRRQREIRNISLKEIADATKISKRYLEAIEKDDYQTLPAPVFTRGFVREYARYLGLNAEDMVDRYMTVVRLEKEAEEQKEQAPPQQFRPITLPRKSRSGPPETIPRVSVDFNILALVLLLAALAGVGWWMTRSASRSELAEKPVPPPTETVAAARPQERAPEPGTVEPAKTDELVLRLTARANSWIDLDADGERAFKDEVRQGDEKVWRAKNEFRFRSIGNAGGIDLTLNDIPVGPLGDEGQVLKDKVYDREFLSELMSSRGRSE